MIELTVYPSTEVSGFTSKWNAAHHPIVFKAQRKDFLVSLVSKSNDNKTIITLGTDATTAVASELEVGQFIYVSKYGRSLEILEINGLAIKLNYAYGYGRGSAGYVNFTEARANYHVEVRIYEVVDFQYSYVGLARFTPDLTGLTSIDVQRYCRTRLSADNEFEYDVINERDLNLSGNVGISIREVYTGSSGTFSSASEIYYYSHSAKQIHDIYGASMARYTPFISQDSPVGELSEDLRFKFLHNAGAVYWQGYPFDVSFIWDKDNTEGTAMYRREQGVDVNGSNVGSELSTQLLVAGIGYINRLMLSGSYASNIKYLDLWIGLANAEGESSTDLDCYVEEGYVEAGYVSCSTPEPNNDLDDVFELENPTEQSGTSALF